MFVIYSDRVMRTLICIPTYNEADNIAPLIDAINAQGAGFDLLVIDDASPDGTGRIVAECMAQHDNLTMLERKEKGGLASAYIAGFKFGLEKGYDYVGEMDADFSHSPEALQEVQTLLDTGHYQFLIGSRYTAGGGTKNWGSIRRLISRFGSLYARSILRVPIADMTGGFNFWSADCLRAINLDQIVSEGYVFQIELKTRAHRAGMAFREFPIIFEDRRVGQSKMTRSIIFEAFYKVIRLRFAIKR